jgi:iron complex outermembrane receptor protein
MNARYSLGTRSTWLALAAAVSVIPVAMAQTVLPAKDDPDAPVKLEKYVVTGSSIKRTADEGAVPMEIFTPQQFEAQGVTSVEQMVMNLNVNGNSIDNLASNTDVVNSGTSRGLNGVSAANLRFQGSNSTLILLNGRRVAQAALGGAGVVDLNSIPFEAIKRVEVLKDGASSIYGTEAIGGVINFILRDDYQGLMVKSGIDVTEEGGGNIYRFSAVGGWGDLNKDHFNLMAALSVSDSKLLLGTQRDWVNTQQPDRGLSADTRGTPYATLNGISSLKNVLSGTANGGFVDPNSNNLTVSTVNTLILQGPTAYANTGMFPYDYQLWSNLAAQYGATVDTGRYAALQQPLTNKNLVLSGKYKLGEHIFTVEGVFGRSESTKWFSPSQLTSSTAANTTNPAGQTVANPLFNLAYPSTGPAYNAVFAILAAKFPQLAVNNGLPMPIRWRFYPGGDRRYSTHSETWRVLASAEGPLSFLKGWDYRTGVSRAKSSSYSVLAGGYYYTQGMADLINTGVLNPFSFTQTDAAMQALAKYDATGVHLYGGDYTTDEFDFTTSGPIFQLPAGPLQGALGFDYRRDNYALSRPADPNLLTSAGLIANAPFDFINATSGDLKRSVRAVFAELDVPLFKGVDFNPSVRTDDYSGFGRTTNPKYTLKIVPADWILFRGSYSTGFRVPTFGQEYYPTTVSPATSTIVDPVTHNTLNSYNVWTGGKLTLEPETAHMKSAGVVISPNKSMSFSLDWWEIERANTITTLGVTQILTNYTLFPDRLIRSSPTSDLSAIDNTFLNAGGSVTEGIEFTARGTTKAVGGRWDVNFNISDLLVKKSKILPTSPYGASEVGHFPHGVYGELGLKYKSTTNVTYTRGKWSVSASQIYRSGYMDQPIGNIFAGTFMPPDYHPKVDSYTLYNLMFTYKGLFKNLNVTAGVKNVFNTHPPFVSYYETNSGAGSDWDPRVVDPRDRSFVLSLEYKFF